MGYRISLPCNFYLTRSFKSLFQYWQMVVKVPSQQYTHTEEAREEDSERLNQLEILTVSQVHSRIPFSVQSQI